MVTLTNVVGADLLADVGEATINDNDAAPQLSIGDATVTEGIDFDTVEVSFDVTLDAPSGQTVSVDYSTADDTATQPDDYTAVPATPLVFAPGQTSQTATVIVKGDSSTKSTRRSPSTWQTTPRRRSVTGRPWERSRTTTGRRSRSTT